MVLLPHSECQRVSLAFLLCCQVLSVSCSLGSPECGDRWPSSAFSIRICRLTLLEDRSHLHLHKRNEVWWMGGSSRAHCAWAWGVQGGTSGCGGWRSLPSSAPAKVGLGNDTTERFISCYLLSVDCLWLCFPFLHYSGNRLEGGAMNLGFPFLKLKGKSGRAEEHMPCP